MIDTPQGPSDRDPPPKTTAELIRELVELGPEHVTTETNIHALVKVSRLHVKHVADNLARQRARAAARARAYREANREAKRAHCAAAKAAK